MEDKIILNKNSEYANRRKNISIFSLIFSPMFFVIIFMILEIFMIYSFFDLFYELNLHFYLGLINIMEVVYIVNSKRLKDSFKITWMIIFVLLPGLGAMLYIILGFTSFFNFHSSKLKNIVAQSYKYYDFKYSNSLKLKMHNHEAIKNVKDDIIREALASEYSFFYYFYNHARIPIYKNTELEYFSDGKAAFEDIIEKLKSAKKFIFIEIFILSDGIVWQEILNVLKEKAATGVEVKILVDGINCLSFFNKAYCKYLETFKIEAKIFKPVSPLISNTQNRRDHRKIFVIDNEIAYTGGINIADEYANLYERFGVWKDSGIRIKGDAVSSFTIMFLQIWYVTKNTSILDFEKYLTKNDDTIISSNEYSMYVPYADYPNMYENVSLQIYRYMFNTANRYMYIMTPYLVIDEALVDTIEAAAKRGVDIKIIVPHIPDKKYVYYVNRSYYRSLTMAGAKVYEYLPGFVHAKLYLQDDIRAVVGTANLDFRSLYLHYENGIYFFGDSRVLDDVKDDFISILSDCKEMTLEEIVKIPFSQRLFGAMLRMFAPLM